MNYHTQYIGDDNNIRLLFKNALGENIDKYTDKNWQQKASSVDQAASSGSKDTHLWKFWD